MIWSTTLFCLLFNRVLCAARGPLVIHNIHVLNPHAVHIDGLGPRTDHLNMTSMIGAEAEVGHLSVRLQEATGQLIISHAGNAFVGLFREAEDDVLSLHPEQTVLLADQHFLPSGTTFTDHGVAVAEDDILFLALPHINPWPMPPIDLHGAIFNLGASCHISFGDWASRITLLLKDTRVSLIVATIGRRIEGAQVKPYKVMYSGEFDRFYAKMGHRRPDQNGSSSSSAPPPVFDEDVHDITREYDDEEEEYYEYDEEYDEYYEEEEEQDEAEDDDDEEDEDEDEVEDNEENNFVPDAASEETTDAPVVASNPSETQQAPPQSHPSEQQLPPSPAQHHLQPQHQMPPPSPFERINLEFSNDGLLGELEKMIEELKGKPQADLDAIDPSMAFETPPRASVVPGMLLSSPSPKPSMPISSSSSSSMQHQPLSSLASSSSSSTMQHQPLPSLAPSSSSSSTPLQFVPGVDRSWSMEEHQQKQQNQEQETKAEEEDEDVPLPHPRRIRQSGRILLLRSAARQQAAGKVAEDSFVAVPLPSSSLRVDRFLNEKAEKEEEVEEGLRNGKEEAKEEPAKKRKRSKSTSSERDAKEPVFKRSRRDH